MRPRTLLNVCIVAVSVATIFEVVSSSMHAASDGDVQIIGTYAQLRQTAEHTYGYQLQLFRDGGSLVGLWSRANGEPADFPLVRVSDLRWNETTGALRFTSRWCEEVETFEGVLTPKSLAGTITGGGRADGSSKKVELRRISDAWPSTTRTDWASLVEKMLKRRSPKC